ncbi:MAG: hypothetical protein ACREUG_18070 [Steroidobacteraceae bacterium]
MKGIVVGGCAVAVMWTVAQVANAEDLSIYAGATCAIDGPNCAILMTTSGTHDHGIAFAYGAGAAIHFGRLAIRAEYQGFEIGGNTNLISIGAVRAFFGRQD